jgi:hypothetical protein
MQLLLLTYCGQYVSTEMDFVYNVPKQIPFLIDLIDYVKKMLHFVTVYS